VGSGDALAVGTPTDVAEGSGRADVGDGTRVGVAHALALVGTGTGVADPADRLLGLGLGLALGTRVGTAVGQDSLVGTGSGVAGMRVGLAEGALAVAEALGVADAGWDAFLLT
jgi:hypothetical protein